MPMVEDGKVRTRVAKWSSKLKPRVFSPLPWLILEFGSLWHLKNIKVMKIVNELTQEITELIKFSPRRVSIFLKWKKVYLPAISLG